MLLSEDLLRKGINSPPPWHRLKEAIIIRADNVARYFFLGTPQEQWCLTTDFPNVAPPFPCMFIEFGMPSYSFSEGEYISLSRISTGAKNYLVGVMVEAVDFIPRQEDIGWVLRLSMIAKDQEFLTFPLDIYIKVKPNGEIHEDAPSYLPSGCYNLSPEEIVKDPYTNDEEPRNQFLALAFVPLLTLCFMNCRNVKLHEDLPVNPCKRRKQGVPFVKRYTLEIKPMIKILRREGNMDTSGFRNALHICRGHFKDYRESGLFGKYKGIYWWDAQVRGSASAGSIEKDYSIQ